MLINIQTVTMGATASSTASNDASPCLLIKNDLSIQGNNHPNSRAEGSAGGLKIDFIVETSLFLSEKEKATLCFERDALILNPRLIPSRSYYGGLDSSMRIPYELIDDVYPQRQGSRGHVSERVLIKIRLGASSEARNLH